MRDVVSQLQAQIRGPDHQDAPCMPWGVVQSLFYIPEELSAWMGERQADFQDAFADGDNARILEISSKLCWGSLLSCSAARVVAMSLLDFPGSRGADGCCPLPHDVEQNFRHASLDLCELV